MCLWSGLNANARHIPCGGERQRVHVSKTDSFVMVDRSEGKALIEAQWQRLGGILQQVKVLLIK